ncbi:MAG TPA: IPT/TIG domain-containing protein, partial [Bryobacteraceae bacterium]|nr:IPT/TIG domain-containing protein [Bryobacteraceae bacterium]
MTPTGAPAGAATNWSGGSITVNVPGGAATGPVVVTVGGIASHGMAFSVTGTAPKLTSVSPASGVQGASVPVTLTGTNFSAGETVTVASPGVAAASVCRYSSTQITATFAIAPAAAPGAYNVTVTTSAGTSNAVSFTVIAVPSIGSVSPTTATGGAQVTIAGSYFGQTRGAGSVWLGSAPAAVVSWSDTQIVATVASNAQSGNALVQQSGLTSNAVPFTVITPTISTVTPTIGAPSDTVTIAGSAFGASQGSGQVWLGTAAAVVQSWSDTQIVAQVGATAASGNAQVLQNGVMSNPVAFTVNTPQITGVSPASGAPGTLVTFTGSGFGASQGNVTLGSMAGQVQAWSDTQVTAAVASTSVTGIARIQRSDGLWSNALGFTAPAAGGGGGAAVRVAPSLLNMSVGDTHPLQALSAAGQSVTGQTWKTSDATVVSLSTDDPPLLTALAAGHVTITAGGGSADVTVWAGALPVGTAIWSNPGDGSGVNWIVPAAPSASGVADVFAIQQDGTVEAITSDGTLGWTADVSQAYGWRASILPDFQGGLVVAGKNSTMDNVIWKLDGLTGQPYPAYTTDDDCGRLLAVHPDGTIFTVVDPGSPGTPSVVGIDPTTGAEKFRVSPQIAGDNVNEAGFQGFIIAGDGYLYAPYAWRNGMYTGVPGEATGHLRMLRVGSDGTSQDFDI